MYTPRVHATAAAYKRKNIKKKKNSLYIHAPMRSLKRKENIITRCSIKYSRVEYTYKIKGRSCE